MKWCVFHGNVQTGWKEGRRGPGHDGKCASSVFTLAKLVLLSVMEVQSLPFKLWASLYFLTNALFSALELPSSPLAPWVMMPRTIFGTPKSTCNTAEHKLCFVACALHHKNNQFSAPLSINAALMSCTQSIQNKFSYWTWFFSFLMFNRAGWVAASAALFSICRSHRASRVRVPGATLLQPRAVSG